MDGLELRMNLALQAPRLAEMDGASLLKFCSGLISQCYVMVGYHTYNERDIAILSAKLSSDLLESYSYFTKEEVMVCFELGAKGQFGDYNGVNLRTFSKWLKAYKTSELRYQAKLAVEAQKKALPPVSEAYNLQAENRFLQNSFRRYKESGSMERVMSVRVYQTLQERGIIHNTREEKYHAISLFERWKPASGAWMPEEMRQSRIKTLAQEWLLKQYFDSIEELKLAR